MSTIDTILVSMMKSVAEMGVGTGSGMTPYMYACRQIDRPSGTVLMFTRDEGMHSCGWWKNPDYERCYHLTLSFRDPVTFEPAPQNKRLAFRWVKAFFDDDINLLWCEPPYSRNGRLLDVWHYRLFCDPAWEPIKPRGEVYSRELTEAGYKTFSEIAYHRERDYTQEHE